jgi:hypothetical protein
MSQGRGYRARGTVMEILPRPCTHLSHFPASLYVYSLSTSHKALKIRAEAKKDILCDLRSVTEISFGHELMRRNNGLEITPPEFSRPRFSISWAQIK